jgi:hypothetical protein
MHSDILSTIINVFHWLHRFTLNNSVNNRFKIQILLIRRRSSPYLIIYGFGNFIIALATNLSNLAHHSKGLSNWADWH